VVTKDDKIIGVMRVNTGFRQGLEATYTGVTLGDVAQNNFTTAHEDDVAFDVIDRMWHEDAAMAVVLRQEGLGRVEDVCGIISKEHVADSVAASIKPYVR
jgi:CIC family chloride channel protein